MSSDSSEKCTAAAKAYFHGGAKPPEQEQLSCPRCQSSNTKFCYYNNYNLSQPRYFCKSCRRYWTRGGTLRNVPVGGGTRKSSSLKRSRAAAASSSSSTTTTAATSPASSTLTHVAVRPDPDDHPVRTKSDVNMYQAIPVSGGFGSLLGGPQQVCSFGSFGFGSGLKGLGFGWDWPAVEGGGAGGVVGPACNTWQVVEGGVGEGECFGWPDLAISNPENGV